MSLELENRLFQELEQLSLVDPHSHINPHSAPSTTLADILGYHYYTELTHSAGLSRQAIEEEGISPKEKVARIVPWLAHIENTVQHSWLIDICKEFLGFEHDRLDESNWEPLFDKSVEKMKEKTWEKEVLEKSKLEGVFLTNDFDDPLEGFDTSFYIPCLRTDDLVFHLGKPEVRERLEAATNSTISSAAALKDAIGKLFTHFTNKGAKACAISLPPDFSPAPVSLAEAETLIEKQQFDNPKISQFVFWTLTQFCEEFKLPFRPNDRPSTARCTKMESSKAKTFTINEPRSSNTANYSTHFRMSNSRSPYLLIQVIKSLSATVGFSPMSSQTGIGGTPTSPHL